jgi:DNA polymerase III alpha subunit
VIPLFKSHYSIGKSILTLDDPDKDSSDGTDSIFSIAQENNLKQIFLVEDSMVGFFNAFKKCKDLGIQLIFGYRFSCCTSDNNEDSEHKLIAFAKNDNGCKSLNKLYSFIHTKCGGKIKNDDLFDYWSDDLIMAVPFYDSFIFKNHLYLGNCIPQFKKIKPIFFIERNRLPFDSVVELGVNRYVDSMNSKAHLVKSIYYKNKSDCQAFQTYKIICNRSFSKERSLSSPNLDHFGSDEFCWESYLEYERRTSKI